MNYQYINDGTTKQYIVNGQVYQSLEEVPQEHRAYFTDMDKNNNGMPDDIESLMGSLQNSGSVSNVLGSLFKTAGEQMTRKAITVEEVKETIEPATSTTTSYDKNQSRRGAVMRGEESSFLPTLIKICIVILIGLVIAWYFGVI